MLVKPIRPLASQRTWLQGFTLIELMVAVSLVALLSTLALPFFRDFVAKQRVRNASFELVAALTLARSQAITQNGEVFLKKRGSTWDTGWIVTDGDHIFGAQEALQGLRISNSGELGTITYGRDGRLVTGATKFTIQDAGTDVARQDTTRCIAMGLSGMPVSTPGGCS